MSADNNIHNDDVDVDIDYDVKDDDQHMEKKKAKISTWNLGKNLINSKKKSSNPDNQRDRDQNFINGYDDNERDKPNEYPGDDLYSKIRKKEKSSNVPDNQRDSFRDQNIINGYEESNNGNSIYNNDDDLDNHYNNVDIDGDQHVEEKETKSSKWNLGKNLINSKKKSSNQHHNQRDRDQNIFNGSEEEDSGNIRQSNSQKDNQQVGLGDFVNKFMMRKKTVHKSPDIEQGLGTKN